MDNPAKPYDVTPCTDDSDAWWSWTCHVCGVYVTGADPDVVIGYMESHLCPATSGLFDRARRFCRQHLR